MSAAAAMWLLIAAAVCALVAVLLAWPVPDALCAARWPRRSPRAAIVLWQLVGLAGGLSAVGALLLVGFAPLPRAWAGVDLVALVLAALLFSWLLGVLATSALRIERDLRRQRAVVDLLGRAEADGVRVLEHPEPLAYCLPGPQPRIVITDGVLAALPPDELAAVLAHERAHAKGRHELVIQPFVAWQSALPFLAPARRATAAVAELVEMLADDAAAEATSRLTVARALARVGSGRPPGAGTTGRLDAAGCAPAPASVLARVRRLT
ncbi:M56 family metallopeptidase [Actinocrinis puniceicyclus]|uniref:M56 family metallopeptidase n=1 Tax=Actinocrinis puniceicyclus TaxID=977794 RepID=A0A8J8BEJ6_9ACTN|nr:M56 family metallopeptidase [Actinocrinis puniceicyclus]MBS2965620.1 M56 family metallopeptidase [Actinocrinis puniceicyclus]